ncbi:MAG: penicillin-binding protein 2 [Burkholderiaceae bacterium]
MEVRNLDLELHRLRIRLGVALGLVLICFGILFARFYFLQVHRYQSFHAQAEDNRITVLPVPPQRGQIVDRNGILMAENVFSYALEVAPARIADLDQTIERLGQVVEITAQDKRRFRRLLGDKKFTDTVPLKTRLSDEEVARIAAVQFRFEGVEVKARPYRHYPLGESAAHVIGHIGRISPEEQERLGEDNLASEYAGSTHMGKLGIELSYERDLHGEPGLEEMEVSAGGKAIRSLSRSGARSGHNLALTIDARLQKLIEKWYGGRKGALVAIEPATGEIVAFVSMPTFDPNLFVDGIDAPTWQALNGDPDRPLLNRPLRGAYPPGSTYKPFMALAVMKTGIRRPNEAIADPGFFQLGNHRFRDSKPGGHGRVDLFKSVVVSSDTYYYSAAYEMGVDAIHDFMKPWGFGQLTGIDLRDEATGVLPSTAWKKRRFKQPWFPGETPSIGIGQGYNNFTILQLAHAMATLARDGTVVRPHLVRSIEDPITREKTLSAPRIERKIELSSESLALVKAAMIGVNTQGTGRIAFKGAEYVSGGKTGTAQVIGIKQNEKYDASKIAERFRDHSLFVAFAPVDKPKLALALIVENGGFGAQAAAPIARMVFDYHLLGKLPKDEQEPYKPLPEEALEMRDVPESTEPEEAGPMDAASVGAPAPGAASTTGMTVASTAARATDAIRQPAKPAKDGGGKGRDGSSATKAGPSKTDSAQSTDGTAPGTVAVAPARTGTAQPKAGPAQVKAEPAQANAGSAQANTGPAQSNTGPAQAKAAPARANPAPAKAGPSQNEAESAKRGDAGNR